MPLQNKDKDGRILTSERERRVAEIVKGEAEEDITHPQRDDAPVEGEVTVSDVLAEMTGRPREDFEPDDSVEIPEFEY